MEYEYTVMLRHNTDPAKVALAQSLTPGTAKQVAGTWYESSLGYTDNLKLAEKWFDFECRHLKDASEPIAVKLVRRPILEWEMLKQEGDA